MKKSIFFLLFLLLGTQFATAQSIAGSWNGVLDVMQTKLHLVFHIVDSSGQLSATMDSPDQNTTGIPVSAITFNKPDLHIEVGGGAIVYEGKLTEGDSIKGTFRQSGMSFPLNLQRGGLTRQRPQEPKPPYPYLSQEVSFSNEEAGIRLAGTLTQPKEGSNFPAVILITGSGPQDRDETMMGHKPFLVIADYLTRNGIAVLRFDDRGTAASEGDFSSATTADFVTDVAAAVRFLKQQKGINPKKIGLIGHSEGGIIAPMVAASNPNPDINFIVLLAAPGFDGKDILIMQNEALARAAGMSEKSIAEGSALNQSIFQTATDQAQDTAALKKSLAAIIGTTLPDSISKEEQEQHIAAYIAQITSPWMLYFLKNNPADYLKKVTCPVLALGGAKDLQVPAKKNIAAIQNTLTKAGNKSVTTKIFPDLNHLFQKADTGLPNEYSQIEETFAPEVLTYMTTWIKAQVKP